MLSVQGRKRLKDKVRIRQLFHNCTGIVSKAEYFIQDHMGLSLHEVLLHTSAMMF